MGGILRLVCLTAALDALGDLRDGVLADVVPINTRFGCVSCQVLEEHERPGALAITSVWRREEDLDAMRAAPEYQALAAAIRQRTADGLLHETLFRVLV